MKSINKLISKYKSIPIQVRASFWFLICAFMQKGISIIVTPIFTRLMTTDEYGEFSVFISWLGIISVIVSMNLYAGVYSQGLVKFEDRRDEYASSLQGLSLFLVLLWSIVYFAFHGFWNRLFSLSTYKMVCMFFLIWTTSVFQLWAMKERVDFRYRKLAMVTVFASLLAPILGIIGILFVLKDKVMARILSMVITSFFAYSWMFFSQLKRGKRFFSREFWKYAFLFNLPLIPHYLSMTILNSADRIMIERICGSDKAGIYNLAYSISQIMIIFNTASLQAIEPWLYKKIKARSTGDISRVAYPSFVLIAVVNILLILFAPEVIKIFAPEEYYEAIYVIPPVAMSVYFMFLYTFFAVFEFYYEKTKLIMIATLSGAILNIILNYYFINIYGYFAAGYTTLACYMLYALLHYVFMKRITIQELPNIKIYDSRIILGISFLFITAGFLCMLTYALPVVRYGVACIALIIVLINRENIMRLIETIVKMRF